MSFESRICSYTKKLKDLREDRDLNQTEIAKLLHVAQTTYSDYENGRLRMPIEFLITLAAFYDVDLNYITGISEVRRSFPKK